MKNYQRLKTIYKRLSHLQYLQRILMWDEAVMMPQGAGDARAHALATLSRSMQKLLIAKKNKNLLALAQDEVQGDWDKANLFWMTKLYQRANAIPLKLTEAATHAALQSEQAWRQMRAENNWTAFLPYIETSFHYVKEIGERRAQVLGVSVYDAMLDEYAPGFNQQMIDPIFTQLKETLPELIQKIVQKQAADHLQVPQGPFTLAQQKALGITIMQALGFDFAHGRLDVSHHPFCSGGPKDVRMTTRYTEHEFLGSLFAICHETGHALYEQGLPLEWLDQPVGHVHSMANHESQSLLMEMEVCRSQAFNEYLCPLVREQFGANAAFTPRNLYRLVTRVQPSLIRVDADEVTYPLHIILRYEIEKKLFNNEITIKDLPDYWDKLMQTYLGLGTKGNDKEGVMQDVHWPAGAFGYFPAYTLGRLMAAQIFASYKKEHPNYTADIEAGHFKGLRAWLKENISASASSVSTDKLLRQVTGKPLDAQYFLQHIKERYLGE